MSPTGKLVKLLDGASNVLTHSPLLLLVVEGHIAHLRAGGVHELAGEAVAEPAGKEEVFGGVVPELSCSLMREMLCCNRSSVMGLRR